jgi:hypothetical protein
MSDEQQEGRKFQFKVPNANLAARQLEMLLQIRASVDALAVTLFYALAQDEEAGVTLARLYEEHKEEFFLKYAFELQDTPGEGGTPPS